MEVEVKTIESLKDLQKKNGNKIILFINRKKIMTQLLMWLNNNVVTINAICTDTINTHTHTHTHIYIYIYIFPPKKERMFIVLYKR